MIPHNLLPERLNQWIVAGGWAACPQLATDTDVFVLAGKHVDLLELRQELLDHLKDTGLEFSEESETREFIGYDGLVGIGKVARVWRDDGSVIHILVASTSDPRDVLNSFDLSISMVGIMPDGRVITTNYTTSPVEPIIVVKDTPTTAARLKKYNTRFILDGRLDGKSTTAV